MSRRSPKAENDAARPEMDPRAFLEPLARILNVSGCHPRDLQREFVRICRDLPIPKRVPDSMHPDHLADLSHLIARWHADAQYVDADGRPLALLLEGPEPSLEGLVSRVLPSIDPAQAIQWLIELKGIRRNGKRFRPTDKYLAFNRLPRAAWAHGLTAVLGMLRTVEHNVSAPPGKRLLERIAINPSFPVRALPQFHRELKRQAGEIVWRFDSDMRLKEAQGKGGPITRLCIGLYAFEDPLVTGRRRGATKGSSRRVSGKRRSRGGPR